MLVVGFFSWWYGVGYKERFLLVRERLASALDYFSIGLLLKTLFAPYKQISAGKVRGPLPVILRAWVDRSISRIIGAIVRIIVLVMGIIVITAVIAIGIITLLLWAIVPLAPLAGLLLYMWGWVPVWS